MQQVRLAPTTIQNVVTYTVVIDVPNPDLKLMPGMTANITMLVQKHNKVLKVLTKALRFNPPAEYYEMKNLSRPDSVFGMADTSIAALATLNADVNVPGSKKTLWIKRSQQDIEKVEVTIGISDGNYTEISGPVKAGDEAIVEAEVKGAGIQGRNPFMPQFRPRTGGTR